MYQIGTVLKSLKKGKLCHIESMQTTRKGTLYTVQYETGEFRRYYETTLVSLFETVQPAISVPDNVLYVDFVLKRLVS